MLPQIFAHCFVMPALWMLVASTHYICTDTGMAADWRNACAMVLVWEKKNVYKNLPLCSSSCLLHHEVKGNCYFRWWKYKEKKMFYWCHLNCNFCNHYPSLNNPNHFFFFLLYQSRSLFRAQTVARCSIGYSFYVKVMFTKPCKMLL